MAKRPLTPSVVPATLVVAASNSLHPERADYRCTGINDHLVIQAALDALPATGGEVKLLDGTYNIEVSLSLDSYQTLRGCGRNTILTTTTANLDIITATGASGAEKTGILIADLCIDGNAGGVANDTGILWTYIDDSVIENVWSQDNDEIGILLDHSDSNRIVNNVCQNNTVNGIHLTSSNDNSIVGNICSGNTENGIRLYDSSNNTVSGNSCQGNAWGLDIYNSSSNTILGNVGQENSIDGIDVYNSSYNIISGNIFRGNSYDGIYLYNSHHNIISNNTCSENSQGTNNTDFDIDIRASDYNSICNNICRAGTLTNKPKYGLTIYDVSCDKNIVQGNDLYNDGFGTAPFNDAGTLTHVEDNNRGITIAQIKMFRYMKNTSGAQRVAGDVVSLKAIAAGNEVTAPAAIGERQVYGMVAETINDAAWGLVQVKGKTTALKGTNAGGGNIVIGDNLITENGVRARKAAAATDPIFARALEALAAADGVIDAYILSPWD